MLHEALKELDAQDDDNVVPPPLMANDAVRA
jgi:hypothetical protein